jgi:hypothetical protein
MWWVVGFRSCEVPVPCLALRQRPLQPAIVPASHGKATTHTSPRTLSAAGVPPIALSRGEAIVPTPQLGPGINRTSVLSGNRATAKAATRASPTGRSRALRTQAKAQASIPPFKRE